MELCAVYSQTKGCVSYYVDGDLKATINGLGFKPNPATVSDMSEEAARSLGLASASTAWRECWVHDSGGDDPAQPAVLQNLAASLGIFTLLDFLATPNLNDSVNSPVNPTGPPRGLANVQPGNLLPPVCGSVSTLSNQPPLTYNCQTPSNADIQTGQTVTLSAWTMEIASYEGHA